MRQALSTVATDWSVLDGLPAEKRRDVIIRAAEMDGLDLAPIRKGRHALRHPQTGQFTQHPVQPGHRPVHRGAR